MELAELRQHPRAIFDSAVHSVDACAAVRKAAQFDGRHLRLFGRVFDLALREVYVVAIGKAAYEMAVGLNESIGDSIKRGIITSRPRKAESILDPRRWHMFAGGHPLPSGASPPPSSAPADICRFLLETSPASSSRSNLSQTTPKMMVDAW